LFFSFSEKLDSNIKLKGTILRENIFPFRRYFTNRARTPEMGDHGRLKIFSERGARKRLMILPRPIFYWFLKRCPPLIF